MIKQTPELLERRRQTMRLIGRRLTYAERYARDQRTRKRRLDELRLARIIKEATPPPRASKRKRHLPVVVPNKGRTRVKSGLAKLTNLSRAT
jgi:hypothetical protein